MEDLRDSLRVVWRVSVRIDGHIAQLWDISTTGVRVWGIQTSKGQRHRLDLPSPDGFLTYEVETVWVSGVMAGMRFLFKNGEQRSGVWELRTLVARGKL